MKLRADLSEIERKMLERLYGEVDIFGAAHSLRLNGKGFSIRSERGIEITAKKGAAGIDVRVEAGLRGGMLHIPVLLLEDGLVDKVENDFYIGAGCEVVIMAGCGIHSDATHITQHDGVHRFYVGAGARVRYVENHFGEGGAEGRRSLNPITVVELGERSVFEMATAQLGGVSVAKRLVEGEVRAGARLVVKERLLTDGEDRAETRHIIRLVGAGSGTSLSSRSVARGGSRQKFVAELVGRNDCVGHAQCDGIVMDEAEIVAMPAVAARHADAKLTHEAAIGRIADEQIVKLMSLGLTRAQAEQTIVDGFLK